MRSRPSDIACRTARRATVFCSSLKVDQSGRTASASSLLRAARSPSRDARMSSRSMMSASRKCSRCSRILAKRSWRCSALRLINASNFSKAGTCSGLSLRSVRSWARRSFIRALACSARRWRHSSRRSDRSPRSARSPRVSLCCCPGGLLPGAGGIGCGCAIARVAATAAALEATMRAIRFMRGLRLWSLQQRVALRVSKPGRDLATLPRTA